MEGDRVISGSTFGDGNHIHLGNNYYNESTEKCVEELFVTDPRRDKERIQDRKGGLLDECYRWILENESFSKWLNDPQSRLLWIKGDPGKGKTMLLCGIIDELNKTHKKPVYFFCQAADDRLNTATAVLRGLIYFLVEQQPALVTYVRKEYMHSGKRLFEDVNAWHTLSTMLIAMLADPLLGDQILIVDALDECATDLQRILDFVSKSSSSRAKWIVSSRNLSTIEQGLDSSTQKVRLSLELNEKAISAAVRVYIHHKVTQLASKNKYDDRTTELVRNHLTSNANDTFLWVALVCNQLTGARRRHISLESPTMNSFPPGLDALYGRMMGYMFESDDAVLCKEILAAASVVFRPLSLEELVALVPSLKKYKDDLDSLKDIVGACGSFLTLRAGVLDFVHMSAKDFLLETAFEKILLHGIEHEHRNIFLSSMEVLYGTLRRNVYGLRHLGHSIGEMSPPREDPLASARYSCVYWVNHLCASKSLGGTKANQKTDAEAIYGFLHKKFIYWLEALTLMRSLSEGVGATRALEKWAEKSKGSLRLLDFIRDAQRFVLSHRTAFEITPMQLYASALVFSPTRSLVREAFKADMSKTIVKLPMVPPDWDACLWSLENDDAVASLTASSQLLASVFFVGSIKIWDLNTGALLLALDYRKDNDIFKSVMFTANDQQIASVSDNGSIKIWDLATGACLSAFDGYDGWLKRESRYTSDSTLESNIMFQVRKIWDAVSEACVLTFEDSNSKAWSVALTAESQQVASAYMGPTVWDVISGKITFDKHERYRYPWNDVISVAFTADGQRLASASASVGSFNSTVGIWNLASGECTATLRHGSWVTSVVFSADVRWLASGSDYGCLKLWDLNTSTCVLTLEGHEAKITSIAFTANDQRLITGSTDGIIKIWDLAQPTSVSMDRRLASKLWDKAIRMCDTARNTCGSTLEGHSGPITSLYFFANGQRLCSRDYSGITKIWDTATGACVSTFKGLEIISSAESQWLASNPKTDNKRVKIKIWNTLTGMCVSTIKLPRPRFVSLSADGQRLASSTYNAEAHIWDTATGTSISTLKGVEHQQLVFSPDARRLTTMHRDGKVGIWDTATGALMSKFETKYTVPVIFSANGQRLACVGRGRVEIWDTITFTQVLNIDDESVHNQHHRVVFSLAFSDDGRRLAAMGPTNNIMVWNLSTGACVRVKSWSPRVKSVAFTEKGDILTNVGVFSLGKGVSSGVSSCSLLGYGISEDGTYIMRGDERVLWLPVEYRSDFMAVYGETVAIGCKSGRVVFFKFSAEETEV